MTSSSRTGLMLALALAAAGPAGATTLADLSVDQMTDASDLVVRGRVANVETDVDEHGHVVTLTEVEVTQTLKGVADAGDWLTVEALGGVLEGELYDVPLAARYSEGEDVVLFLAQKRHGTAWGTVGMYKGKYTVKQDPGTGRDMVVRFTVPLAEAYDARFIPNPPKGERVMLTDLDAQVRARVEKGWDGEPIPGASPDRLHEINRLQPGVR